MGQGDVNVELHEPGAMGRARGAAIGPSTPGRDRTRPDVRMSTAAPARPLLSRAPWLNDLTASPASVTRDRPSTRRHVLGVHLGQGCVQDCVFGLFDCRECEVDRRLGIGLGDLSVELG